VPGLETPDELAARFDARAPTYDEGYTHRLLADAVAGFVDVAGVADVLDAATGTGLVLRALAPRLEPGRMLTGIDLSPAMLAKARQALPEAVFVIADAVALPFDDASFDLVTCVTAIHLMPDPTAALHEWRRVLRPAGHIVVANFTAISNWGQLVNVPDVALGAGLRVVRESDWVSPHDEGFAPLVIQELART
jgi:ubiquinone/menaquinone biosynthesis C-methylase UbiE